MSSTVSRRPIYPRSDTPKECTGCHQVKAAAEFYTSRAAPDGLNWMCKACTSKKDKSPRSRFSRARALARKRGHYWGLTFEQYLPLVKSNCTYCGWTVDGTASGIDRIVPKLGYVEGNCAPACNVCNPMKGANFTASEAHRLCAVVKEIRAERLAAGLPQPEAGMPKSFNVRT